MASMEFNGMDIIISSMEKMANLQDDDFYSVMRPAAEYLREKYSEALAKIFKVRTGQLSNSIKATEYIDYSPFIVVGPKGKHLGSAMGKRANGKHAAASRTDSTNAEIAYYLEYGSPRIPARHWMEHTNDAEEESVLEIMSDAWGALMDKIWR